MWRRLQAFGAVLRAQVGRQFLLEPRFILERALLSIGLQEEVKGVVHRHLDHQIDRNLELLGSFRKDQPPLVIDKGSCCQLMK